MQTGAMRELLSVFFTRLARRVIEVREVLPVAGGSTQPAWRAILADGAAVFVKAGVPEHMARLKAEARGLETLKAAGAVRVPEVLLIGGEGPHSFLVLEHFALVKPAAPDFIRMGRELAQLHRVSMPDFGFERDNFLGPTPQVNTPAATWPAFFRDQRLLPQLRLAASGPDAGMWTEGGLRIAESIELFFPGYAPRPSLLHGDLWRGNAGFLEDGTPVMYDPAVYYGDREADLAMTELFGGFGADFLAAYREAWPLDAGYPVRRDLYNLYHVLNHANLSGGAYVAHAQGLIRRLIAEIR
jgi:fructosamine-3-kinase